MSIAIHKSDERLYKMWREAERRKLDFKQIDESTFEVTSFSRPGLYHHVEVIGDEARCSCESTVPQCTHIATVFASIFPVTCWLEWSSRERREWAEKKLKKERAIYKRLRKERERSFQHEAIAA